MRTSKKGSNSGTLWPGLTIMSCTSTHHSDNVKQVSFTLRENCGRSLRHKRPLWTNHHPTVCCLLTPVYNFLSWGYNSLNWHNNKPYFSPTHRCSHPLHFALSFTLLLYFSQVVISGLSPNTTLQQTETFTTIKGTLQITSLPNNTYLRTMLEQLCTCQQNPINTIVNVMFCCALFLVIETKDSLSFSDANVLGTFCH